MATHTGHVMTLANSIIGVSILAMPFCFKQCGITLAILMLFVSSIITRFACHFLLKSAVECRRKTFELLAFRAFGSSGKLAVELGVIGFLMGTCIAFFVVMGDLGPSIMSKILNVDNNSTLRSSVLLGLGIFIVLPLGLLKNVESLGAVSTVTIFFYMLLVLKLLFESTTSFTNGEWMKKVVYWRPEGILQCIPIFSMALACQTQIFEIFDVLPNPNVEKMNSLIRAAVNMCTGMYIAVGLLGYIAFSSQTLTGNVLLSFSPTISSDLFKVGFVLSLAVSFPCVIFPCRASLYSLIYKRFQGPYHELVTSHIPDSRFKFLTVIIVAVSLVIGLLIPSIELVLGLVGSTIGVAICLIFPSVAFMNIFTKETNERLVAKAIFIVGAVIMIAGTYANLYAANETNQIQLITAKPKNVIEEPLHIVEPQKETKFVNINPPMKEEKKVVANLPAVVSANPILQIIENKRIEPPIPIEPAEQALKQQESQNKKENKILEKIIIPETIKIKESNENKLAEKIDKDAIQKEEEELKEDEKQKNIESDKKETDLLKKLEEHKEEQKKLLEEQKQILKDVKLNEEKKEQELLKKLEEHKEEQKQLLEEQKQILKELKNKDSPNDVDKIFFEVKKLDAEEQKIKPEKFNENIEKIQNVIDDLKDSNKEIKKEIKEDQIKIKEEEDEKKKIISMPLPLAKLQMNTSKVEIKKEVETKQQAMQRDILDSEKKERLKREIDEKEKALNGTCEKKNATNVEVDKKVVELRNKDVVLENKNVDVEKEENLVKNINYLSVPDKLPHETIKNEVENPGVILPVVPRKRDLKSIEEKRKK